jgi:hypothetical protein
MELAIFQNEWTEVVKERLEVAHEVIAAIAQMGVSLS